MNSRTFTDYSQNSLNNEKIKKQYGITNNQSYREFLVKHADLIMKRNFQSIEPSIEIHNTPYLFLGIHDDSKPKGYSESSMKDVYLSRERLNAMRQRRFIN